MVFSKEIRAAAIEAIKAVTQRRREEMVAKVGRQLYALSAAQNRAKLNSSVASSNPVPGGEQDANDEAFANSNEEERKGKGKETATTPSSTDQQTTDDTSVTWESSDPETGRFHRAVVSGLLQHKRWKCEQQRAAQIKANEAQSCGLAHLGLPDSSASRDA
ncbi:hypothetical protein GCG54_00006984 [Colletotrichum gloeosporioides]|uniref:Uncharacterized protein n=1 Tax=Colletotrichum gloeosporioides TaxID=474922 RepID=A0A8H4CB87_COLGL|nr:uncharacterized protein GCG54_00006984 [Colletotrichum gloeosporioides]KAF3800725.1 hypothetical protein GCG54_00006984 [Colletotrichum gloeosporioides]